MLPAIFGSSVVQINLLLDTLIASFLITGSISWLYYSDRLVEFPLGVFGIALATVILPKLSKDHATSDPSTFSHTIDWALRWVWVIGTPAAVGLAMLAGPMLATLFYGGKFGETDVAMATLSLMAYSLGLLGFIFVKVLAPGFFARQDTKTPVKIGIIAMAVNMGLNIAFVVPLYTNGFQGAHMGLALATACSSFLNAYLLFRRLKKDGVYQRHAGWVLFLLRIAFASTLMGTVIYLYAPAIEVWLQWDTLERAGHLGLWIGIGMSVYFTALLLSGLNLRKLLKVT